MSKAFNSLGALAGYFGKLSLGSYKQQLAPLLDEIGKEVADEVKKEIGTYQGPVGPFPATAPLSPVTLEIKARKGAGMGGNPDTPLYETGDFQGDVRFQKNVSSLSVEVGTDQEYIAMTELGTSEMPPRPVFGPAALRALPPMRARIEAGAAAGIIGGALTGLGVSGTTHTPAGDSAYIAPE